MSRLNVDKITGKTGTNSGAPITLSGDTATLGSGATLGSAVVGNWGWVLLQTATADNTLGHLDIGNTLSGEGTDSLMTSTYKRYKILLDDCMCTGGNRDFFIQMFIDGTQKTTEYDYAVKYEDSNGVDNNTNSNNATQIKCNGSGINNYSGSANTTRFYGLSGEINLFDPAHEHFHFITGLLTYHSDNNMVEQSRFSGGNSRHQSNNGGGSAFGPLTKLRLYFSGSNFFRGTARLYGLKNA